jgi:T4-like virus tail tube protein gp19
MAVPQFPRNAQRYDPYKNFKFRIRFGTSPAYVAGVSKVSALKRTTEVVKHREGGDPSSSRKSPGRTGLGREVSLKDFRRDITIEVYNEAGQLAIAYNVYNCWVSEYQALPDLDANANAVAIQHIKLENEGWEREPSVTEPVEISFEP